MYLTNASSTDLVKIGQGTSWFNSGNVGIGSASPGAKLDVAGKTETDQLQVDNLPAFASDLNSDLSESSTATFVEITGWRTSGVNTLFNNTSDFNTSTGRFTAQRNGFYFFSAQIRIDGVGSGYARIVLGKNGSLDINGGFHAIANSAATNGQYLTLNVSGVMKLASGDYVSVFALSQSDNSWSIQKESGFNGYMISDY